MNWQQSYNILSLLVVTVDRKWQPGGPYPSNMADADSIVYEYQIWKLFAFKYLLATQYWKPYSTN